MTTKIEGIGNSYGSLHVKKERFKLEGSVVSFLGSKYFMKVFCEVSDKEWREISKELYEMLIKLNK